MDERKRLAPVSVPVRKPFSFKVGDKVRLTTKRTVFSKRKGYVYTNVGRVALIF